MLKENRVYWQFSLSNPEPIFDQFYIFEEIIVEDKNLTANIKRLRELIISFCNAEKEQEGAGEKLFLDEIYNLVTSAEKIQYTEFIAYWKTLDMTQTVFKGLPDNKKVLAELINEYCKKRKDLYDELGYSNVVVQALYDNGASRKKGSAAITKISEMCKKSFKNLNHCTTIDEFNANEICYILPDNGDDEVFKQFLEEHKLEFAYGKGMQNKMPDFLLKHFHHFFIIEAKHLKEGGGEQNKSVGELIEFVRQKEKLDEAHYVGFMDGVYFNLFISLPESKGKKVNKIEKQRIDIENALKENRNSFVVNSAGLELLFEDLAK